MHVCVGICVFVCVHVYGYAMRECNHIEIPFHSKMALSDNFYVYYIILPIREKEDT